MLRRHHSIRNFEIRTLLDTFLVVAIATDLIIRLQLWATHYPKLGGGKLHIAHLLWGGLGMLIAIVILLSFLGRARRHTAAFIGGIGFGFFIDEIGKFVTSNNDYFFKPAAGMIYIIFILLYLVVRELGWRRELSMQECVGNAMAILSEASFRPLRVHERALARELLNRCQHCEPLGPPLLALLDHVEAVPEPEPGRAGRLWMRLRRWYEEIAEDPRFARAVVAGFLALAVLMLVQVTLNARGILDGRQHVHVIAVAGMTFTVIAAGLILIGAVRLRHSRLDAYRWFDRALLAQIFFGQVFAFLQKQFAAVFGLLLYMALLAILRTIIHAEVHASILRGSSGRSPAAQARLPGLPAPA